MATAGLFAGAGLAAATVSEPISSVVIDGTTSDGFVVTADLEQRGTSPFEVEGDVDAQFVVGGELLSQRGPAICLDVRGHTAGSIFRVENPGATKGLLVYGTFVDGGAGGTDRFAVVMLPDLDTRRGCAPRADLSLLPFVEGGLVIRDGEIGAAGPERGDE